MIERNTDDAFMATDQAKLMVYHFPATPCSWESGRLLRIAAWAMILRLGWLRPLTRRPQQECCPLSRPQPC